MYFQVGDENIHLDNKQVEEACMSYIEQHILNEIHFEHEHLSITKFEYNKLIEVFGKSNSDDLLNKIVNYPKNKKYKSLYLTARNWGRRAGMKPPQKINLDAIW